MIRKIVLTFSVFLFLLWNGVPNGYALADNRAIEVFDLTDGKVITQIPNTFEIQQEIKLCLNSIDGMTPQMYFEPEQGVMLTIPVEPSVFVDNSWYRGMISEVYLYLSPTEKPKMLLFTEHHQSMSIHFQHDFLSLLLQLLNHSGLQMTANFAS